MPPLVRPHLAAQPDSVSLENLAMLADRAVAAEKDVDEANPGVAEINVSESGKLVGLLENLSRRLKKLETATAKATQKKTYGSQANENRALRHSLFSMCKPNHLYLITKLLLGKMFAQITKKIVVLTHRRRKYSKITLFNRPTQSMHKFATTTKLSVKRRVCAVKPVRRLL